MLGYIVGSRELHDGSTWLNGGECWVTWWGVLGYMIEFSVICWCVELHDH